MDLAQWPKEIVVKQMEEIVPPPNNPINKTGGTGTNTTTSVERKLQVRPQKDQAVNCPRCNSTNTKFCYYNNYSLSQPRYFCKTCRRYWTAGGSLRNIPVGGGSRKNKLRSPSSTAASEVKKLLPADLMVPPVSFPLHHQNPNKIQQDLSLGSFSHHQDLKTIAELIQVPNYERNNKEGIHHPHHPHPHHHPQNHHHPSSTSASQRLSALELLTGMTSTPSSATARGGLISSFLPMPIPDPNNNSVYSSFSHQLHDEFKPTLNFSLDGMGNGDGGYNVHHHHHLQGMQETSGSGGGSGRLFFPFEDLKSGSAGGDDGAEEDRDHPSGYWNNGVLGAGGGSW
ncbi:unnamed protein product [Cuscuta europaea]|uniref:Dof zinc finger protein n=1 Tax=Cuscuta europaea TaxID=41803 RepID=A0A9P0YM34_CUSEU|nr:unnamed protein product [Cuscuta europaea]